MSSSKPSLRPSSRIVLWDKPPGVTSHDVVAGVRREYGERRWKDRVKVGHAGTLDPFATGLLVILVGRATRLQPFIQGLPKTYEATAQLGWRSSTGDPDGELTKTGRFPTDLTLPTGSIEQTVPMTSAVRVEGERLYRKAHRGEAVDRPSRTVEIHDHRILSVDRDAGTVTYEIRCSSGTYVRTLIESLGDAYCAKLRRTAIGTLRVPESEPEEVTAVQALAHLPERPLSLDERRAVGAGRPIEDLRGGGAEKGAGHVLLTDRGELIAIAEPEGGRLRPRVVLV